MPTSPVIRAVPIDEFEISRNEQFRAILAEWVFYDVSPGWPRKEWPTRARDVARAIERVVPMLLEPGLGAWLGLFGPFLPEGIIGAADILIRDDTGGPYYLPSVECPSGGPGYVETYMGIEWRPGSLARLFDATPAARSGFLPCDLRASIVVCPHQALLEVGRHGIFDVDLLVNRANDALIPAFRNCTYVILPDLDFEMFYFGAIREKADVTEKILTAAWELP
jgi:hypothetical protein